MRQWLTITVSGLWLTLASSAQALGIGEPQQVSPLNQPLHVLLPLTDGAGLEPGQISVAIADDAAYRQSGLARSALVDALSTQVVRQNGSLMLVIDSPRRVREPFLDLLLVVTWPGGQWQRDVSLLFDPVDYAGSQPLVGGDQTVVSSSGVSMGVAPQAASMSSAAGSGTAAQRSRTWPTLLTARSGDSLSSLAASLLPRPGMSRQALMVALFEANPAAFVGGDINRLRAGAALDVPPADDVTAIPRGDAATKLQALVRETDDGRPVIDVVGRDTLPVKPSEASPLAALERRLNELAAETERQRAAILALQTERDGLQSALAAAKVAPASGPENGGRQASDEGGLPVSEPALAAAAAVVSLPIAAMSADPVASSAPPSKSTPALATQAMASSAVPSSSAPAASLWQRLLGHLDWIGGGLLIVLLGVWVWQRRRGRDHAGVVAEVAEATVDETSANETSPKRTASAVSTRRVAAVNVDSASISQADIYMAYGRHAEARDWLRQQLMEREDAQLRLGLLRALGELRDLDGLEEALAGFGDDATPEQRREGQSLVDDYRARHVEESWEEATAEVGEDDGEVVWQGGVDDIDALFESQVTSPPAREASPVVTRREFIDVEAEHSQQPMSALFDDELTSDEAMSAASDESAGALRVSSIDYVAPTLDVEAGSIAKAPSSPASPQTTETQDGAGRESSSSMPEIDFSTLSLTSGLDPAAEPALGPPARSPDVLEVDAADERESVTRQTLDGGRKGAVGAGSGSRADATSAAYREVPAGWDVEEVEFQSPHRDNGRP